MKIKKVVIPAAGFGTRFLPQTKAMPKEMLPIVDKPVIQYVVEEAVEAGIEDVIIVTGSHKRSIEDHFDYPFELTERLKDSGKTKELDAVVRVAEMANFIYIRQKGPMGNATPILNAAPIVGNEPFMVLFGDDFIVSTPNRAAQMISAYEKYGGCILSAIRTQNPDDADRYGFAEGEEIAPGVVKTTRVVEKPGAQAKPSDLAIVSGFIFTPEIFDCIETMMKEGNAGTGGEYVYTDALNILRGRGQDVHAVEIQNAHYYDTGNKLEYMKTIVDLGLKHPEINGPFKDYLKSLEL